MSEGVDRDSPLLLSNAGLNPELRSPGAALLTGCDIRKRVTERDSFSQLHMPHSHHHIISLQCSSQLIPKPLEICEPLLLYTLNWVKLWCRNSLIYNPILLTQTMQPGGCLKGDYFWHLDYIFMHLVPLQHCQMDSSKFCLPMVIMYACNITSNGLCISVAGRGLLEGSRQTCFTDILLLFLLLFAGQPEPRVVEPRFVLERLFRGRGRGTGTGMGRWRLRVQLGAEWLPI